MVKNIYFLILIAFNNYLSANYQITVAHSTTVVPSATYTTTNTTGEYNSYIYNHDDCHLEFGSLTDAMNTYENQNSVDQIALEDISANNLYTISERMDLMELFFLNTILLSTIEDVASVYHSSLTADSNPNNDYFVSNIEISTAYKDQKLNTLNVGNSAIITLGNSEMHNLGLQVPLKIKIELIFDGSELYLLYARWFDNPLNSGSKQSIVDAFFNSFSSNYLQEPFGDSDGDSLNNYDETFMYITNPYSTDSDLDGIDDSIEINIRTNQNLKNSIMDNLGLIDPGSLNEIRANSKIIQVSGNQATVQLQMEESSDLQTWEDTGTPATMTIPADTDTKFFRFKMAE